MSTAISELLADYTMFNAILVEQYFSYTMVQLVNLCWHKLYMKPFNSAHDQAL